VCVEHCDTRYDCWWCESCGTRHSGWENQCDNCDSCDDACECNYCGGHGERTSNDVCGDCEQCTDCGCECGGETDITLVSNPLRFWDGKPSIRVPWKRHISCEIELSEGGGRAVDHVVEAWSMSVVEDGSVADGCEINTAPASGDAFERQMGALTKAMLVSCCEADYRCGVHVHVDTRDFSFAARGRMIVAYALLEEAFFSLVPASRRGAKWCEPRAREVEVAYLGWESDSDNWSATEWRNRFLLLANSTPTGVHPGYWTAKRDGSYATELDLKREVARKERCRRQGRTYVTPVLATAKVTNRKSKGIDAPLRGPRYYAFNVKSMFTHGTVEFRLPEGTADGNVVAEWGILVCAFAEWSKNAKLEDLLALRDAPSRFERLLAILPTDEQRSYWRDRRNRFAVTY